MARFNVVAVLRWSVETEDDPAKLAADQLKQILANHKEIRTNIKIEGARKDPQKNAIVVGEFSPSEVLPFATWLPDKKIYKVGDKEYHVKMNSRRYFVFKTSLKCVACGLEGTKMLLEQSGNSKTAHFNLYAVENGGLVLMTKDHITPRSCGGGDSHSNYQTMCSICNNLKGSSILTLENIATLRKLYNENRGTLSRKKLGYLLEETRNKLAVPSKIKVSKKNYSLFVAADKSKQDFVIAKCDINVMQDEQGQTFGYSMHDRFEKFSKMDHIASIKKGTLLRIIGFTNCQLIVALDENRYVKIYHGLLDYNEGDAQIQSEAPGEQSAIAG